VAWAPHFIAPPPLVGMPWFEPPERALYGLPRFTDPAAYNLADPRLLASIQGIGWFTPPEVAFFTRPRFTDPAAVPPTIVLVTWSMEVSDTTFLRDPPIDFAPALPTTAPQLFAGIGGMSWFTPPEVTFYTRPRFTDPAAIQLETQFLPPKISGMAWFEPPDQPFWTRPRFTDPEAWSIAPTNVTASTQGMAWFTPPEVAFYGRPRFTDPPSIPPTIVLVTWSMEVSDTTFLRDAPIDFAPALPTIAPAAPAGISGMAWFTPPEVAYLTRPHFTDPRATDGTPPYTLPPKIAGMAWFTPPERAFITRAQFTDPWSATLTPATLPPKVAGMAWFTPPERPFYGIPMIANTFPSWEPQFIVQIAPTNVNVEWILRARRRHTR
jgi:hypothetical protein